MMWCSMCYDAQQLLSGKCFKCYQTCIICGVSKELTAEGMCKPCKLSRSCESCSLVNLDRSAAFCGKCPESKQRLAMWCSTCFDDQQRTSGLCVKCHQKYNGVCGHCNKKNVQIDLVTKCSDADCNADVRLCSSCVGPFRGYENLNCKTC